LNKDRVENLDTLLICLVIAITDGDTLRARCDDQEETIRVRLADIDAPERKQPFGTRSWQSLDELCQGRQAEIRVREKDRYARAIARVVCEGTDANAEQIRLGMAWAYRKYLQDTSLVEVETEAKIARRGLWVDQEAVPPWEWRRMKRRKARVSLENVSVKFFHVHADSI
jgi:endonuclease YncB( thermonuclease family)